MTALTIGHDKAVEEAMEDIEEAGIAKIQRVSMIKGNAQRRRMDALLQYWDDLAQALADYQDCLDEQEADEESENQD